MEPIQNKETMDRLVNLRVIKVLKRLRRRMRAKSVRQMQVSYKNKDVKRMAVAAVWEQACAFLDEEMEPIKKRLYG